MYDCARYAERDLQDVEKLYKSWECYNRNTKIAIMDTLNMSKIHHHSPDDFII